MKQEEWIFAGQYRLNHGDVLRLRIDDQKGDYIALTAEYNPNTDKGRKIVKYAKLIAAAPELLELVKSFLYENSGASPGLISDAYAILDKIEVQS